MPERELACISKLVESHGRSERIGIIGATRATLEGTGNELKRCPSAIYWNGLRKLRMRTSGVPTEQFEAQHSLVIVSARNHLLKGEE